LNHEEIKDKIEINLDGIERLNYQSCSQHRLTITGVEVAHIFVIAFLNTLDIVADIH